jgi:hypothetical protein
MSQTPAPAQGAAGRFEGEAEDGVPVGVLGPGDMETIRTALGFLVLAALASEEDEVAQRAGAALRKVEAMLALAADLERMREAN